jgi:hypothetical protein
MCRLCKPEPGDLIFTRDNGVISKIIRYFTGGKYSHVGVYFGKGLLLEADWNGVVLSSLDKKYHEYEVVSPSSVVNRVEFLERLLGRLGDGYDYSFLFGNVLYRMFGKAKAILGFTNAPNKWVCSELIALHLKHCCERLEEPIEQYDPQTLREFYIGRVE